MCTISKNKIEVQYWIVFMSLLGCIITRPTVFRLFPNNNNNNSLSLPCFNLYLNFTINRMDG